MAKGLGLIKGHGKRIGIDEILKQNERENLKNSNRSIKFFKIIRRYCHIPGSAKRILKKRTQKCEVQVIEKKNYQKTSGHRIVESNRNQNSFEQDTIIG